MRLDVDTDEKIAANVTLLRVGDWHLDVTTHHHLVSCDPAFGPSKPS